MEFIGHIRHTKGISVGIPREFIGISRHSKGILLRIQWNSKAYQKGIHYSRHCKGIHRNLKAFQREFTIIGIPREFIWIPRHSRRDFTEDPNGIRKDSKAFQKGIHYSTHCKGIHRNLKAFQRALCILREFA